METLLDPVEIPVTLDEFAVAWAEHERRDAQLALAAAALADRAAYGVAGYVSMVAWLRSECRMNGSDATSLLGRGRFLHRYDEIAAAVESGVLSAGQVAAIRAVVTSRTEALFDEQHADLVPVIAPLSVAEIRTVMQVWKARADALTDTTPPCEPDRSLTWGTTDDGTAVGRFTLDDIVAAELERAIGTAKRWDSADDSRPAGRRNADALFDILAFFNANHDNAGTPRHRPHIELVLDADDLDDPVGVTTDGDVMNTATTGMLACDAVLHRVRMAGNAVLDYGRAVRSVPTDLFRALALRDGGCRYPGCDRPVAWTEAHHTPHWTAGGQTRPDLLILLCTRHHHHIHSERIEVKILPDATAVFTRPDGTTHTSQPHARARGRPRSRPDPPRQRPECG